MVRGNPSMKDFTRKHIGADPRPRQPGGADRWAGHSCTDTRRSLHRNWAAGTVRSPYGSQDGIRQATLPVCIRHQERCALFEGISRFWLNS